MEKKGMKDAYICNNLHYVITLHKDDGTTPMFMNCPICKERATSRMGQVNQNLPATYEWFKPTPAELDAEIKKFIEQNKFTDKKQIEQVTAGYKDHVGRGGLLLRPIVQAKIITAGDA